MSLEINDSQMVKVRVVGSWDVKPDSGANEAEDSLIYNQGQGSQARGLYIQKADGGYDRLVPESEIKRENIFTIGGRWYMNADNRWVYFSTAYGAATENYSQNAGTGTEPTYSWAGMGPMVFDGARVTRLRGALRSSNSETTGANIRLVHHTGDFTGTWDSNGETTFNVLYSGSISFTNTDWLKVDIPLDGAIVGDGFIVMYMQPIGTITALRYVYSSLGVTVELA